MKYIIEMQDGQCNETRTLEADESRAAFAAEKECEDWARGGEWGDDGARIEVSYVLTDEDGDVFSGWCAVTVPPNTDALVRAAGGDPDCDHDWSSEGEGGCRENPGVWSAGGTAMIYHSHCTICGLRKIERTAGMQRNPGEHDTVAYVVPKGSAAIAKALSA